MAEPSSTALHHALSSSYAAPTSARLAPGRLGALVEVLAAELRTPGDRRTRQPIPRVVVGFALWNLVAHQQRRRAVPPADRAAARALESLITDVFGWRMAELRDLHEQEVGRPSLFSRQYGVLDYRLDPPTLKKQTVTAKVTTLVPRPLAELRGAADPAQWEARCGWLWSDVVRIGPGRYRAKLAVPRAAPVVHLRAKRRRTPFGLATEFVVTDPRGAPRTVVCSGSISVEKARGQPWATRITQEKALHPVPAGLAEAAVDALSYWIQAETVSLATPPPVHRRSRV